MNAKIFYFLGFLIAVLGFPLDAMGFVSIARIIIISGMIIALLGMVIMVIHPDDRESYSPLALTSHRICLSVFIVTFALSITAYVLQSTNLIGVTLKIGGPAFVFFVVLTQVLLWFKK